MIKQRIEDLKIEIDQEKDDLVKNKKINFLNAELKNMVNTPISSA